MYSLLQSRRVRGAAGEPLPTVFQALEAIGMTFRRGQLVLIPAGPGTGKSAFALNYAIRCLVPTLYISADSDAFTQLARAVAIATDRTFSEAMRLVLADDLSAVEDAMSHLPIRLIYDASPTLSSIGTTVEAYEEVYGDYPGLIIVDNVSNVRTEGAGEEEDKVGLPAVMEFLHTMARETRASVFALHHVTGPYNNADKAIPLDGVKGQITDVPEVVLTIHRGETGEYAATSTIRVSVVKNRGGKSDPTGQTFAELEFDGSRMLIRDPQ